MKIESTELAPCVELKMSRIYTSACAVTSYMIQEPTRAPTSVQRRARVTWGPATVHGCCCCCCCSAALLLCCSAALLLCCSAARRADAAHSTQRRARDTIGSVTMPSARSVSAVMMNSMRLIGGRNQLEVDRDGLRWDRAVYHACEGQGSHGPRDDACWARGL